MVLLLLWKTGWWLLTKLNRITMQSSNSTSGYISKRIKNRVSNIFCTTMFISKLFTIAKGWKEAKCSSIYELIFLMWYIHKKNIIHSLKGGKL